MSLKSASRTARRVRISYPALAPEADTGAELRLTIHLVLVARRWRALIDERLRRIGQSAARMETLATINRSPPGSAQVEIAQRIGVEGATLTRMLDSLEADGLVERLADPKDRRTKRIRLTEAGAAALAEILAIVADMRERLLHDIPGPRVAEANDLLGLLLERIDTDLPGEGEEPAIA